MTFQEFDKLQAGIHDEIKALTNTKGVEYANSADRLANFKEVAREVGVKSEVVAWVFLTKHMRSIAKFIKSGQVHSEPIHGRIVDAILYLELLDAIIQEEAPF